MNYICSACFIRPKVYLIKHCCSCFKVYMKVNCYWGTQLKGIWGMHVSKKKHLRLQSPRRAFSVFPERNFYQNSFGISESCMYYLKCIRHQMFYFLK